MVGTVANMPPATAGSQSGSDGVVSGGGATFTSVTGQFTTVSTGDTITIYDTNATTSPFTYESVVTFVSSTVLTLTTPYAGSATSVLPWVLTGSAPSNAGLTYFATDGTDPATGTLYQGDGSQWIPIASPNSVAIPPWFDYTPSLKFDASAGGGDTEPTIDVTFARLMVQTGSGATFPDGGFPVEAGTALGDFIFTVTDPGAVVAASNSDGVLFCALTSSAGTYNPAIPTDRYVVGGFEIINGVDATTFTGTILSDGTMRIGGIPDLFPPNSRAQNCVRVPNPYLTPASAGWPWVLQADDKISASFQYSMGVD